jgi:beta-lactamase class A
MINRKTAFLLVLLFGLSLVPILSYKTYLNVKRQKKFSAFQELKKQMGAQISLFSGKAGIIIKDLDTDWTISFQDEELFPSASLVKIPIMAACFYAAQQGKIDLEEIYRLKEADKVPGSGELKLTASGTKFSIAELIELMIAKSDNTAANIIIDRLGFDYLNATFKVLGLKNTNISRKMMDFKSRKKGIENYTDCRDLAYILTSIYRKALISRKISLLSLELLKQQTVNDRIPAKLPPDVLTAHKTGLERGVCHDAGIVYTKKGDFLICVLTQHKNKSSRLSKRFISQIAFLTFNFYQRI